MLPALCLLLFAPPAVAVYADDGVSGRGPAALQTELAKHYLVRPVTAADIRAGQLAHARALVVPGGVGKRLAAGLAPEGRDAIRSFVASGGCYVGVCAGCYLASADYDWSLGVLPVKVIDKPNWERGRATLRLALTPAGRDWFARSDDDLDCLYHNGPVLAPDPTAKEKLIPLAVYKEEVVRKGATPGLMLDTPAAAAARYGRGWAVGVSPHPEQTKGLSDLVPAAIRWALNHPAGVNAK